MPFSSFATGASPTERASDLIRTGAERVNKDVLQKLLSIARQVKPPGYDGQARKIRQYYEGKQAASTRSILQKRYESTSGDMSVFPLNITKAAAELDATAYRRDPLRFLKVDGEIVGRKIVDDDGAETVLQADQIDRQLRFEKLIELARLDVVLPEMERRTMASETQFARITWPRLASKLGRIERPQTTLFWPSDVFVVPNPEAPGSLWAAHAIIALVGGEHDTQNRGERFWEIWARSDVGAPIYVQIVSDRGKTKTPEPIKYPLLEMPWFAMHSGLAQESVYLDINRDRVDVQDAVNVGLSNWWFKDDLQGHSERVIIGPEPKEGRTIVGGPAAWITLPEGSEVEALNYSHDLTTLEGIEKTLRLFAVSLRQSPDAWATEPGPPLSGVSRIVANIEPDAKRSERINLYSALEETEILPRLVEIADFWGRNQMGGTIGGPDASYAAEFPPAPVFEDPEARRQTAQLMQESRWLSEAEAAVRGGARRSVPDAVGKGLTNDLTDSPAPTEPGSGDRPGQAESIRPEPEPEPTENEPEAPE